MNFMKGFDLRGKLSNHIGSPFIALIAKKKGTGSIKDFRPFNLVGSIYKVLAKVLASKFQKVLPNLISIAQGAFIHWYQILDGVLLANECIYSRNRERRPGRLQAPLGEGL